MLLDLSTEMDPGSIYVGNTFTTLDSNQYFVHFHAVTNTMADSASIVLAVLDPVTSAPFLLQQNSSNHKQEPKTVTMNDPGRISDYCTIVCTVDEVKTTTAVVLSC